MPIITHNKAKGVDHANEIPITMTQESGSSQGTTSIIEPSNIATLDLVPSSMVPTSDTPTVATNEPLSDCFESLVDSHIFAGWIDSYIFSYSHLLPRIPLCRLLANPAICTQDECVAELTTSIAKRSYQPTMARFIVTECFPGCPVQFDQRGVRGRELHMSASFDDQILQIPELKHMEEKMFVVWNGNHKLLASREWAYHERLDVFSTPCVECTLVALNPTKMAEFLLILGMINKVTRVHVPHTTAHDIFMMQKLGLADPQSILDKFDDKDRAKVKRVLRGTAMNRSKWLRLPMDFLSQLLWKVATLIVAMFVHDLDGPLPVPFYDRRTDNIAADIDGYEADSDMLRESSWTLDTSGAAFQSGVEKSEFFARWLIGTFTTVSDAILDCLAGCGGMATKSERLHRHCISIEKDMVVF
ncbi:hypothetical protein L7F22_013685 [Adiantum nelumboides]|nr:hypothetical protein [Adiantum nelumboides]